MDDVEIRRAVADDRTAVLAINNIYGGMNYMQAFYDLFVHSPVVTPYVAIHDGEIVST